MQEDRLKGFVIAGLAILILLIPFQLYFNFYKHLSVSVAQLLVGVVFIFWIFKTCREGDYTLKKTPINLPITIFILIMITSIFISTNKPTSLKYSLKWISSMMIYFIVVNNVGSSKETKRLMGITFASGIVLALIGIIEYILGKERMYGFVSTSKLVPLIIEPETLKTKLSTGDFNWYWFGPLPFIRAFGTFASAIGYAAYLGLILPLSIWLLSKKWRGQTWAGIGILLMITATILSFTRSAWLGMGVSLLLMSLLKIGTKRFSILKIGLLSMISLAILVLAFPLLIPQIKNLASQTLSSRSGSISERLSLWGTALNIIKAKPLLGVGVANYKDGARRFGGLDASALPAHSNYLQIGAEMGLLGLAAFLWIIAGGVISSWRIFKKSTDEEIRLLGLGFLGFWIWFAIQSQFATYYEGDKFSMLFWMMVGLNMVLYKKLLH